MPFDNEFVIVLFRNINRPITAAGIFFQSIRNSALIFNSLYVTTILEKSGLLRGTSWSSFIFLQEQSNRETWQLSLGACVPAHSHNYIAHIGRLYVFSNRRCLHVYVCPHSRFFLSNMRKVRSQDNLILFAVILQNTNSRNFFLHNIIKLLKTFEIFIACSDVLQVLFDEWWQKRRPVNECVWVRCGCFQRFRTFALSY